VLLDAVTPHDVDPKGRTVRAQGGVTWGELMIDLAAMKGIGLSVPYDRSGEPNSGSSSDRPQPPRKGIDGSLARMRQRVDQIESVAG
jgi:hypothetical protein